MEIYTPASDRIVHSTYADFTGRLIPRPVHLVQYDNSLPILAVTLYNDGQPYVLPENSEVNIRWHKRDNNIVYNPALGCDEYRGVVYFEMTQLMTILEGVTEPVVEIMIGGAQVAASGSFKVIIDRNPVTKEELASASEAKALYEYVEMAETAAFHSEESAQSSSASETRAAESATAARASEINAARHEGNAYNSAEAAAISENNAATSEASAIISSTSAKNSADDAEAWAVGTVDGEPVEPTEEQYNNNSKYWAGEAAKSAAAAAAIADIDVATTEKAGIVRPDGATIEVDIDGRIQVPKAAEGKAGIMEPDGETLFVGPDGKMHGATAVEIATTKKAGIVKPDGSTTWVDPDGTLHAKGGGGQGGSMFTVTTQEESFEGLAVEVSNGEETVTGVIQNGKCELNITRTGLYRATIVEAGEEYFNEVLVPYFGIYSIEINKFACDITVNLNGGVVVEGYAAVIATHEDGSTYSVELVSGGKVRVGKTGTYTIQAFVDGIGSSIASVNVIDQTPMNATVKFAKLVVNVECEESANLTVSNGTDVFSIVTAVSKTVSKYVGLGTWTVSGQIDGKDVSAEVVIDDYAEKSVSVKGGAGLNDWVHTRFPELDITDISELTEKQIRELMTVQASVDMLVDALSGDAELAYSVLDYDLCAKWINLRDYALDMLYANESVKAVMDEVDKYGYGEWVQIDGTWQPKGLVPVMTANNAPYGTVTRSSEDSRYEAWKLFDSDDSTYWAATTNSGWVAYEFANPSSIKKIKLLHYDSVSHVVSVGYCDDGTNWNDVPVEYTSSGVGLVTDEIHIDIPGYHKQFRVSVVRSSSGLAHFYSLQFYGRQLSVSVPTMTSNTEPWGEASASSVYPTSNQTYEPWRAFVGKESEGWGGIQNNPLGWVQYKFNKPIVPRFAKLFYAGGSSTTEIRKFVIQDGEENNISEEFTLSYTGRTGGANNEKLYYGYIDLPKASEIDTVRFKCVYTSRGEWCNVINANIYGLDYSEREFAEGSTVKYIYDHGVELEELEIKVGGGSVTKNSDSFIVDSNLRSGTSSSSWATIYPNAIDLTDYKVVRYRLGRSNFNNVKSDGKSYIGTQVVRSVEPTNHYDDATRVAVKDLQTPLFDPDNLCIEIDKLAGIYWLDMEAYWIPRKCEYTEWWLE